MSSERSASSALACDPGVIPFHERASHFELVAALFGAAATGRSWDADGLTVTFPAVERGRVERFVENERKWCSFLRFSIEEDFTGDELQLSISGPAGARQIIEAHFLFHAGGMMSQMQSVNDANFDQKVGQSAGLVLVDVWAAWCGPCRLIKPILEELSGKYKGQAQVLSLDADDNPEISSRFGVRSLPTVLFFRDGVLQDRLVGALPKAAFEEKITALSAAPV